MQPETRYAKSGDVHIAYQVVGEGPLDLVWVPGFVSHLEVGWEEPEYGRFFERLASFSRVIIFDKRGTGLSDRVSIKDLPTLEQRMDDIRAVMDCVGSKRAAVYGISEGSSLAALFAATYPERVSALLISGSFVGFTNVRPSEERLREMLNAWEQNWGQGMDLALFAPGRADDERFRQWWARFQRMAASPGAAVAILRMNFQIDIRHVLPAIRVPTLILHQADDRAVLPDGDRYIAQNIPGARYVEIPGAYHWPWMGDSDALLGEVQEFLTGVRPAPEPDRVLATVLFTDIVASTERAVKVGDRRWRDLLDSYYALTRKELVRFRGREVKTMGDGFLATFDGPARGIRCACAVSDAARQIGIETRAGLHTGECELIGDDVGGIAVHIGARVAATAGPDEVLVSSTVKDLVAGSGLRFEDRGVHTLKGVPEEWRLFAVDNASAAAQAH
ncbi:MAG: adenylate/guanylate cyclase domain-containing protein [Dehalococcoidia bacterium]|nr:adenylate/guanylate cyclase domain-containing protein [Dehalococcoidia bacterium]